MKPGGGESDVESAKVGSADKGCDRSDARAGLAKLLVAPPPSYPSGTIAAGQTLSPAPQVKPQGVISMLLGLGSGLRVRT